MKNALRILVSLVGFGCSSQPVTGWVWESGGAYRAAAAECRVGEKRPAPEQKGNSEECKVLRTPK